MNPAFFQQIETILAPERLGAYRQDGATPATTLARYLLNMALCEALYSPLQFAEVALRNALHTCLTARFGTATWYDVVPALPAWQQKQLDEARQKLQTRGKPATPGALVAELQFGFWTGFFNKSHGGTGLGHALAGQAFAHAPRSARDMKKRDARWKRIRDLRNRVFHHERIIRWLDLDAQHAAILEVVGWMNQPLRDFALVVDRYDAIRKAGLPPWLDKLHGHWPDPARLPTTLAARPTVAIIPEAFDATRGTETPFGHRWGGDVFRLSAEHLAALQAGQTLALDVQNEYIAFLISAESAKLESAIQLSAKELAGIRSQPVIASDPREIGFHAKPGNEAQPKGSKK